MSFDTNRQLTQAIQPQLRTVAMLDNFHLIDYF